MNPQEKKDMYRLSFASMTWIRFQGSKQHFVSSQPAPRLPQSATAICTVILLCIYSKPNFVNTDVRICLCCLLP